MIRVESAGLLTTVQDLGRPGHSHFGISAAGAADPVALRVGNRLVGNQENAPALELTLTGGAYRFEDDTVVAVTGGDCESIPSWQPFTVRAGQTLRLPLLASGARAYLCVRGGISVPRVLGSASTHLMSGIGGFHGRALKRGDSILLGNEIAGEPRWNGTERRPLRDGILRVTPGPQADWFSAGGLCGEYTVREDSDRMGVRLAGTPVMAPAGRQLLTEGVSLGAIQVPPDGAPIILFVDHQTTGGYPKIANVISADLWKVGQLRPRDPVRFETVTVQTALEILRELERQIKRI